MTVLDNDGTGKWWYWTMTVLENFARAVCARARSCREVSCFTDWGTSVPCRLHVPLYAHARLKKSSRIVARLRKSSRIVIAYVNSCFGRYDLLFNRFKFVLLQRSTHVHNFMELLTIGLHDLWLLLLSVEKQNLPT